MIIKRLNLYQTISEFETSKHTLRYPCVSYIREDGNVHVLDYEKYLEYIKLHSLTFTAEEDGSSIGLAKLSTNQTLEYSIDTVTWNTFDTTTNIYLNNGNKVYVRGILSADNTSSDYTQFNMSGKIAASGNCNAIWNYEDLNAPLKACCGYLMFFGCTSLTIAPELPATTLTYCCYFNMFFDCTSLVTAPELPATTLAYSCYVLMFRNCTNLTTAPELPATALAEFCYNSMFYNCTSLVTAPELPATTLVSNCYSSMFMYCTKLNYIKCLATDSSASNCTYSWVNRVASTGTFVKHPDMNSWATGTRGIPTGWVVEDAEIPYVTFTAQQDGSSIRLAKLSTNQTLEYSTDTTTWNTFDTTTSIPLNNRDKVYVRGILSADNTYNEDYDFYDTTQFKMDGTIAASGNCNAIWNYQDLNAPLKTLCGYCMFCDCYALTTAPELPATTLAEQCYQSMFWGCYGLITAPELPATTLSSSCYDDMFNGCSSLTTAPELPATTLAWGCYSRMFGDCYSLITSPELPATTLTPSCYYYMFENCRSLTSAPELPATTLVSQCYQSMFKGCNKLNHIKCLATDISSNTFIYNWVSEVSSTGTFIKHPDMNDWTTGISGIPEGWVVEDADMPYVTFTALEDNSSIELAKLSTNQTLEYSTNTTIWNTFDTTTNISLNNGDKVYIRGVLRADNNGDGGQYTQFKMSGKIAASGNCNALWNYEDLNAPLKNCCGYRMFENCASLTTAPELPATTLANACYRGMFRGCTSLTTTPELPATKLASECYCSMFQNCTSLIQAPELPVTTLVFACYASMFAGCTSLTTSPELPATKLASECYCEMFSGCTNLSHITCLATDISSTYCTYYWVNKVSSTGTFIKHPDMTSWTTGIRGIPSGWTIENAEI